MHLSGRDGEGVTLVHGGAVPPRERRRPAIAFVQQPLRDVCKGRQGRGETTDIAGRTGVVSAASSLGDATSPARRPRGGSHHGVCQPAPPRICAGGAHVGRPHERDTPEKSAWHAETLTSGGRARRKGSATINCRDPPRNILIEDLSGGVRRLGRPVSSPPPSPRSTVGGFRARPPPVPRRKRCRHVHPKDTWADGSRRRSERAYRQRTAAHVPSAE